jgi:hypothetical protein
VRPWPNPGSKLCYLACFQFGRKEPLTQALSYIAAIKLMNIWREITGVRTFRTSDKIVMFSS